MIVYLESSKVAYLLLTLKEISCMITSGALWRAKRAQRSIMVRKFGYLSILEILVITCPLTPARSTNCPSVPQAYQCK